MEYFQHFFPVLMGSISIFILLKDDFGMCTTFQKNEQTNK